MKKTSILSDLENSDLEKRLIELQKQSTTHAFMIGLAIGILCYSVVANGISLKPATIFPLLLLIGIMYLIKKNKSLKEEIKAEIEFRKRTT